MYVSFFDFNQINPEKQKNASLRVYFLFLAFPLHELKELIVSSNLKFNFKNNIELCNAHFHLVS